MIIYYLVVIFLGLAMILLYPLTKLPDVTLPADLTNALVSIGGFLHLVWSIAPLTFATLFVILGLVIGVETHIFSYKMIKWLYNKIPGIN